MKSVADDLAQPLPGSMNMNGAEIVVLLIPIALLGVVIWGLVSSRKSIVVGILATFMGLVGCFGSWYSGLETRSVPLAAGFGAFALIAFASAARQFWPGRARD